jgi:hypothetical protein
MANDVGGNDPESLICLTHTRFALSRYSYAKAAYFLEQALKFMPELPLANLRPVGFYGTVGKYAEHLFVLQEHVAKAPSDGEALLLLAYFRWFGEAQDVKATHKALSRALACALKKKDAFLVEAIRAFWDGMIAAEKVSGPLEPASDTDAAKPLRPGAGRNNAG